MIGPLLQYVDGDLNHYGGACISVVIEGARKVWTEAELQALPDNGYLNEVVDGKLVRSPRDNFQHEQISVRLNFDLESFNCTHRLGFGRRSRAFSR